MVGRGGAASPVDTPATRADYDDTVKGEQTPVMRTIESIDSDLITLKEEIAKLQAARDALVGDRSRPRVTRTREKGSRRRRQRGRGRRTDRGTRSQQIVDLVRSQPGITIRELAERLGIEPSYLYRVMPKLAQEVRVVRSGRAWYPPGGANGAGAKSHKVMLAEVLGSARLEDAEPSAQMRSVLEDWADGRVSTNELEAIAGRAAAGEPLRAAGSTKAA